MTMVSLSVLTGWQSTAIFVPHTSSVWQLELQPVHGSWKVVDEVTHSDVIHQGALEEDNALVSKGEVEHLDAEDLVAPAESLQHQNGLAGAGATNHTDNSLRSGNVHGRRMEAVIPCRLSSVAMEYLKKSPRFPKTL